MSLLDHTVGRVLLAFGLLGLALLGATTLGVGVYCAKPALIIPGAIVTLVCGTPPALALLDHVRRYGALFPGRQQATARGEGMDGANEEETKRS